MLEKKGIEKYRSSGPKGSTGQGYGQPAQPVGEPIDRLPLFGRGLVKGCTKFSLSPSSLLFPIEMILFSIEVRSRTGRGSIEAMVTYQALNAPTASELVDL